MSETGDGSGWNLSTDGILWKTVARYADAKFKQQANAFVAQLQESMRPTDMLQGLLLDRIAAGCLRKQLLLEVQGATALYDMHEATPNTACHYPQLIPLVANHHLGRPWSANLVRYEALLDQVFHRDLILLLQLKRVASAAPAVSAKKPPQSDRGLIEGQANSNVADQAIGSSPVTKPSPNIPRSEPEKLFQDRQYLANVDLD